MEAKEELLLFNQLFTNYRQRFVTYANSYVRDITTAEDITTESFMSYWENKENLAADSNIPAYILTVLRNKCLNHLQRKKTEEKTLSNIQQHKEWELQLRISSLEATNPTELFQADIENRINKSIEKLPEKTREIFKLSRIEQKSHKEIATALDISTKSVEFHITKSLTLLRKNLKDYIMLLFF